MPGYFSVKRENRAGELSIGISLVIGLLVRISSLFGAFYNFNILFSVGYAAGGGTVNYNRALILLHSIFVSASAGRSLGLDGLLKRRFPRTWLFEAPEPQLTVSRCRIHPLARPDGD